MEDFDVLGIEGLFFFCTLLRVLKQSVSSFICLTLTIINSEVVTREFLGPAKLSRVQTFRVYELAEIVVVGKHKNFMLKAL